MTASTTTIAHLLPGGGDLLPVRSLHLGQRVLDHSGDPADVVALADRLACVTALQLAIPCAETASRDRGCHQLASDTLFRLARRRPHPGGHTPLQAIAATVSVLHGVAVNADDLRGDLVADQVAKAVSIHASAAGGAR